jgi:creatinine amidohydrolase
MSKVVDHPPATFPPYDFFPVKPHWTPHSGCLSSAKPATAEKGRLLFDVCVQGMSHHLASAFDAH